jgi:hypothetical protein
MPCPCRAHAVPMPCPCRARQVLEKAQNPHTFEPYHKAIREPFDYYKLGNDFATGVIDQERSKLEGSPPSRLSRTLQPTARNPPLPSACHAHAVAMCVLCSHTAALTRRPGED